ncbi:unnamed protein product [Allacma fusca]|uniref:Uncharacterized protein n=1 Tax=Allacma fusca TaxID=39272 RepID=A0A8J2J3Q7_9HEXA|nr:unnamed protein product [Allacma fusca]
MEVLLGICQRDLFPTRYMTYTNKMRATVAEPIIAKRLISTVVQFSQDTLEIFGAALSKLLQNEASPVEICHFLGVTGFAVTFRNSGVAKGGGSKNESALNIFGAGLVKRSALKKKQIQFQEGNFISKSQVAIFKDQAIKANYLMC